MPIRPRFLYAVRLVQHLEYARLCPTIAYFQDIRPSPMFLSHCVSQMPPLSPRLHLCRPLDPQPEGRDELTILRAAVSCGTLVIHLWIVVQLSVLPEGKLKAFLNSHQRGMTHIVRLISARKVEGSTNKLISF